MQSW